MGHGHAAFQPAVSKGRQLALLYPSLFREPVDLNISSEQTDAHAWNLPVKVHTYEEYEDDFRDSMKEVGLPLEKE
jgi:hypothetical protein